ncbi:MAG: efflux RND transporter periplasmic adaptor subunit, partial [bacterium]|nr:efflux RND transporter periplasmic adaptor subunit [bacterium]
LEIERIEYDMERSVIPAPFDGVVIEKHTELGQWLGVGDEVVELLSLDKLEVEVDVPEQYFRSVRIGGSASINFGAIPGRTIRGSITAIIPKADEQARTFPVKVRIPDSAGRIGVGMLAQVRLEGISAGGAGGGSTIVPKDAIVRQGPQTLVYVLDPEGGVQPVPVRTGAGAGAWVQVSGSVKPGDRVITRGNERLMPGQKVRGEKIDYPL